MTKTSNPLIGLPFLRKHAAVLDTAQGTMVIPRIPIKIALTDEIQKRNLKLITTRTEKEHTIPAQSNRAQSVINDPMFGTIQPLPQFDECAKLIVPSTITTARDKRVAFKTDKSTDLPFTNSIRQVDKAALNLLTDHDDVVTHINALMQVERPNDNERKVKVPNSRNPWQRNKTLPNTTTNSQKMGTR